jgi:hypothetical protein
MAFVKEAGLMEWSADAAFGIVVGTADESAREGIRATARAAGGSVFFPELGAMPADLGSTEKEILRRLKEAFDPEGKLAPL